jgi:hypothetical protein
MVILSRGQRACPEPFVPGHLSCTTSTGPKDQGFIEGISFLAGKIFLC